MWCSRAAVVALAVVGGCVFDSSAQVRSLGDHDGGGPVDAATIDGVAIPPDAVIPADSIPAAPDAGMPDAAEPSHTTLMPGDVRLLFAEADQAGLQNRRWEASSSTWIVEQVVPSVAGEVRWVTVHYHHRQELAVVALAGAAGEQLQLLRSTGEQWEPVLLEGNYRSDQSSRAYDLAYENSGDRLLVFGDGSARPQFRTWTGALWSEPQSVPWNDGVGPSTNDGRVMWVRLERHPTQDLIALAYADEFGTLVLALWTGEAWHLASVTVPETSLKRNPRYDRPTNRPFDLAWESQSGDLVVAWGRDNGNNFKYTVRSAATGTWAPALEVGNVVTGEPSFISMAAAPNDDRIALAAYDLGDGTERLGVATWNGGGWVDGVELDSQINDLDDDAPGDYPGQAAWLPAGSRALCLYPDDSNGWLEWGRWLDGAGWVLGEAVQVPGKHRTDSVQVSGTGAGAVVVAFSDDWGRLYTATHDGVSWQHQGGPVTTAIASITSVPFGLVARPE